MASSASPSCNGRTIGAWIWWLCGPRIVEDLDSGRGTAALQQIVEEFSETVDDGHMPASLQPFLSAWIDAFTQDVGTLLSLRDDIVRHQQTPSRALESVLVRAGPITSARVVPLLPKPPPIPAAGLSWQKRVTWPHALHLLQDTDITQSAYRQEVLRGMSMSRAALLMANHPQLIDQVFDMAISPNEDPSLSLEVRLHERLVHASAQIILGAIYALRTQGISAPASRTPVPATSAQELAEWFRQQLRLPSSCPVWEERVERAYNQRSSSAAFTASPHYGAITNLVNRYAELHESLGDAASHDAVLEAAWNEMSQHTVPHANRPSTTLDMVVACRCMRQYLLCCRSSGRAAIGPAAWVILPAASSPEERIRKAHAIYTEVADAWHYDAFAAGAQSERHATGDSGSPISQTFDATDVIQTLALALLGEKALGSEGSYNRKRRRAINATIHQWDVPEPELSADAQERTADADPSLQTLLGREAAYANRTFDAVLTEQIPRLIHDLRMAVVRHGIGPAALGPAPVSDAACAAHPMYPSLRDITAFQSRIWTDKPGKTVRKASVDYAIYNTCRDYAWPAYRTTLETHP